MSTWICFGHWIALCWHGIVFHWAQGDSIEAGPMVYGLELWLSAVHCLKPDWMAWTVLMFAVMMLNPAVASSPILTVIQSIFLIT